MARGLEDGIADLNLTDKEKQYSEELRPIIAEWQKQQDEMKSRCRLVDIYQWQQNHAVRDESELPPANKSSWPLTYVGGLDISFVKGDAVNACAAFVVVRLPSLEVVYKDLSMIELNAPYVAGFLGFREAGFLVDKVKRLQDTKPELTPQALIVDGNGILHPKGNLSVARNRSVSLAELSLEEFGLACHVGVQVEIPTLGVSKNLLHVDGIEKNQAYRDKIKETLKKAGDTFPLTGLSGKTLGMALRSCDNTSNPVFVSPGHLITLDTAVWLVKKCCKFRVPEPTRQADFESRKYLRDNPPPKNNQNA